MLYIIIWEFHVIWILAKLKMAKNIALSISEICLVLVLILLVNLSMHETVFESRVHCHRVHRPHVER
ncbi:hypothetical protein BYT27DRAFT_6378210 [Phlegmacium glaucopus]|nr:hypothetical protein BYT27DRAFT_6378210 [Phlegmacium glaucopus]